VEVAPVVYGGRRPRQRRRKMTRVMLRRKRSKCSARKSRHELLSDLMELVEGMRLFQAMVVREIPWLQIDQG